MGSCGSLWVSVVPVGQSVGPYGVSLGPYGSLWVSVVPIGQSVGPYGFLWGLCESLWVSMGPYGSIYGALWGAMDQYGSIYGFLWVSIGRCGSIYGSRWSLWDIYESLWVSMGPYGSLWVPMGLCGAICGSLWVPMGPWVNLWVHPWVPQPPGGVGRSVLLGKLRPRQLHPRPHGGSGGGGSGQRELGARGGDAAGAGGRVPQAGAVAVGGGHGGRGAAGLRVVRGAGPGPAGAAAGAGAAPARPRQAWLPLALPLGVVYFAEYFVNQGMLELLYFPASSLPHSAQYRWYQVFYQGGVCIARSATHWVQVRPLWALALLQTLLACVLSGSVFGGFLPGPAAAMTLLGGEGLVGGAAYGSAYLGVAQQLSGSWPPRLCPTARRTLGTHGALGCPTAPTANKPRGPPRAAASGGD
ncbi:battenin isoform X2 [Phaenicophaeus curvirostris]|uniref:battenin isoform X2 n=1 Tax=Phaenicophaeus curvirostris TaxID=33595 RepID=UPI0037F0B853